MLTLYTAYSALVMVNFVHGRDNQCMGGVHIVANYMVPRYSDISCGYILILLMRTRSKEWCK